MLTKNSNSQYFEGVMQLRNINKEIEDFIKSQLKKNQRITIAKVENNKEGQDIYLSSQHLMQNLGRKLKSQFGGELKITTRLFSQNKMTSKIVYRITVYYRGPDYKKGSAIAIDGKVILLNLVDNRIHGIDLSNQNKKVNIDPKKKTIEILEPFHTNVIKIYPHIEIMDPVSYQGVKINNTIDLKVGEKVKVFFYKGYWAIKD